MRVGALIAACFLFLESRAVSAPPEPLARPYDTGSVAARQDVLRAGFTARVSFELSPPEGPDTETEHDEGRMPPLSKTPPAGDPVPMGFMPETIPNAPGAPTTFESFMSTEYSTIDGNHNPTIPEPSVAAHDQVVWTTGNFYAARSLDAGHTFTYVNPYTAFPPANNGFCCDQVVLYEPSRDILVWLLLYTKDASGNTLRIAVAKGINNQANGIFKTYDLTPQFLNFPDGAWFDFPDAGYGTNMLYLTVNAYTSGNAYAGYKAVRIPLNDLAALGDLNVGSFGDNDVASLKIAQGLSTTGLFATHPTTSGVRIYRWPEGTTPVYSTTAVTPFQGGGGVCPDPGGKNWCAAADGRVSAFWRASGGLLRVMWDSAQGGAYPYPYVQEAAFLEFDRTLSSQAVIWSSQNAYQYSAAGVNARGHAAGVIHRGGGGSYITAYGWVADDVNGESYAPLETYAFDGGTASPSAARWGDFFTARRHSRYTNSWITATAVPKAGGAPSLKFKWMGRNRDLPVYPLHDQCGFARAVSLAPGVVTTVIDDSSYAVFDASEIQTCNSMMRTLWYSFTPAANGFLTIDTCGGTTLDSIMTLYQGASCDNVSLSGIGCADDECGDQARILTRQVTGGQPYKLRLGTYAGSNYANGQSIGGPVTLRFRLGTGPKGDADGDGDVDVVDVFYLINYLFAGGAPPWNSCDVAPILNLIDVVDVFYLISYLFAGGPPP
jgi:hypothetical protein